MKLSYPTLAFARLVAGESKTIFKILRCAAIAMLLGPTIGAAQDFDAVMAGQR
jgi:hypothetical protein